MKRLLFYPEAEEELGAAITYYEAHQEGLGTDLEEEMKRAVSSIQRHPQQFPLYSEPNVRKCVLRRFPYTVFFHDTEDVIWVVAVAHQKRRPGYWEDRLSG